MLSRGFYEIFKNNFFTEHIREVASLDFWLGSKYASDTSYIAYWAYLGPCKTSMMKLFVKIIDILRC